MERKHEQLYTCKQNRGTQDLVIYDLRTMTKVLLYQSFGDECVHYAIEQSAVIQDDNVLGKDASISI